MYINFHLDFDAPSEKYARLTYEPEILIAQEASKTSALEISNIQLNMYVL